jgi:hypothetical protein
MMLDVISTSRASSANFAHLPTACSNTNLQPRKHSGPEGDYWSRLRCIPACHPLSASGYRGPPVPLGAPARAAKPPSAHRGPQGPGPRCAIRQQCMPGLAGRYHYPQICQLLRAYGAGRQAVLRLLAPPPLRQLTPLPSSTAGPAAVQRPHAAVHDPKTSSTYFKIRPKTNGLRIGF